MSVIMADHKKFTSRARKCAAFQLQLHLNTKHSGSQIKQQKHWRGIAADVRSMIKNNLLIALTTLSCHSHGVIETIACIAVMEMPLKDNWPDLVPILSHHIVQLDNEEKESAMEALTSMCQKLVRCLYRISRRET